MFGTIRRHQSWLWVIIATITILSFVVFGPTNTKLGNALGNRADLGSIDGDPITRDQFVTALHEVAIGLALRNQQKTDWDSATMQVEAYKRLLLIQKQKELGIQIGTEAAAGFARRILGTT